MLFEPLTLREVTLRNRIGVAPMCQYSATDGMAGEWHLVHLGARATGGAGLILSEATAVEPRGRITAADVGIWKDEQVAPLARVTAFLRAQGAAPGIQLAHAGRKASTGLPWEGGGVVTEAQGGWTTVAPSPIPHEPGDPTPHELTRAEIAGLVEAFGAAARRALAAGFQAAEIHGAHGYLIHQFLSPLSNRRGDQYGGPLANRMRFALEVTEAVRAAWPAGLPLLFRVSVTDWVEGGWAPDECVLLARELKTRGVDLMDCSTGGLSPLQKLSPAPGFQVPFAGKIRHEAGIATSAVGLIASGEQAEAILREGRADMVMIGRAFLRDAAFPIRAALELGVKAPIPVQYLRGF